jgi:hypothetical protein
VDGGRAGAHGATRPGGGVNHRLAHCENLPARDPSPVARHGGGKSPMARNLKRLGTGRSRRHRLFPASSGQVTRPELGIADQHPREPALLGLLMQRQAINVIGPPFPSPSCGWGGLPQPRSIQRSVAASLICSVFPCSARLMRLSASSTSFRPEPVAERDFLRVHRARGAAGHRSIPAVRASPPAPSSGYRFRPASGTRVCSTFQRREG